MTVKNIYYLGGKKKVRRLRCLLGLHDMRLRGWSLKTEPPKEETYICEGCNRATDITIK